MPGSVEEELRGYLECGLLCSAADKGRISRDIVAEAALTGHGVRLWICPAGVIQRHPLKSETLKRMGPGDNLTVTPAYCNRPHEAVVAVLKAVQDRQIAVRTETVWKR